MKHKAPPLSQMPGMWRRSLMIRADGSRDSDSQVRWLQAGSLFADLRQAARIPDFMHLRGLADLEVQDCAQLARQEGFAGRLVFDGDCFEWQREIDFQPQGLQADAARLWWEEETLMEQGRDVPYVEHWQHDPTVVTRPVAALRLRDPDDGVAAIAVHVGTVFMFARDRRWALKGSGSLEECVAGAPSLAAAREMLDCEITLGSAGDDTREPIILASTHPWRVFGKFKLEFADSAVTTQDVDATGEPRARRWQVIEAEGEPQSVWPPR